MKRTKPIQPAPWNIRAPRNPKTDSRLDPELRQQVFDRDHGTCTLCGERLHGAWECHHRQLRSRGGLDIISNLVALDFACHRRIHGHPAWSLEHGFMVSTYDDDPSLVPVALHLTSWVLLLPDGTYRTEAA